MKTTRKGVSEVITVTLIIVITVIIAGMFFAWTKNTSRTKFDNISADLKAASDLECSNAEFFVDSCTIYSTTKTVRLTLINNSKLKLFNLNLSINGENSVAGTFQDLIDSGETAYLSTDTDFNFTRGDQSTLTAMDVDAIDNITLTNGTCPKEVLDISGCTIVSTFWPPTASVGSGTYYLEQEVTLSAEDGATIYYTLDGNTPTTDSNVYSTPITIPEDANTTLKAIASAESSLASDVNTWVYNITHTLDAPTADPEEGTYYGGAVDVTLSAEAGATIYYTTNGTNPSIDSNVYSVAITIPIDTNMEIRAIAIKEGYGDSEIFSAEYQVFETEPCSIIPEGGEIYFLEHLDYIDTNATTLSGSYTLQRDLNFLDDSSYCEPETYKTTWIDGNGWNPIGISSSGDPAFSFDGNNHTISNLYINRPTTNNVALFGFESASFHGSISNLTIEDFNVIGQNYVAGLVSKVYSGANLSNNSIIGTVSGNNYVGGLSGYTSIITISNNYSNSTVSGANSVGGLVGHSNSSTINYNFSDSNVSGANYVGGLVGYHDVSGSINYSYSKGNVVGSGSNVGGLIGYNVGGSLSANSYSLANVSGTSSVGGFAGGSSSIFNYCYSTGLVNGSGGGFLGGTIGYMFPPITTSYYDTNTSGQSDDDGRGVPKTTTQMKTQSTFTDWNFSTIWAIDSEGGISYPYLQSNVQTPHPGLEFFDPLTVSIYSPTDQNNWIYPPVPTYTYNSYKDFNATISGGSGEYTCSWNLKRYNPCDFSLLEDLGVVSTDCNFNRQLTHACNFYYFELTVSSLGVQNKIDGIAFGVGNDGKKGCPPCSI